MRLDTSPDAAGGLARPTPELIRWLENHPALQRDRDGAMAKPGRTCLHG